jgi:hypothetical protein
MWARVVDGVEASIDVEQRDPNSLDVDGPSGSRRNVFYRRDGDEFTHGADPSSATDRWRRRNAPETRQ